jgi:hypothetical protein
MTITTGYILNKIERHLRECYEPDQFHSFEIDPRALERAGTIKITIMGIPEDDAIKTHNEIMGT